MRTNIHSGEARSTTTIGYMIFMVLALLLPVCGSASAARLAALPSGVPDLSDPDIRAKYRPVQVGSVGGNPDLPLVILVSEAKDTPRAVLVGLDARNGKNTWSLLGDPIVLIVLFENPTTITELLVDPGFLKQGTPSGSFERLPHPGLDALPEVLRTMAEVPARTFL